MRTELKLNRSDVGWYQIHKALQARNASGDFAPVNFKPFKEAYKALKEKLQPMVYVLGFLKVLDKLSTNEKHSCIRGNRMM